MKTFSLSQIADIERNMIAPNQIPSGSLYVGLEHMTGDGQFEGVRAVDANELGSTKFRFEADHVLYGNLRPYLRKIAQPGFSGVCSTEIIPIRARSGTNARYLLHFLRWQRTVDWATSRCTGANLPRLSPTALAELEVPLPVESAQAKITDLLDRADCVRRKRRQALRLADELVRATFLEMVGPSNPAHATWSQATIEQLAADHRNAMRTGPFGSDLRHSEFVDEGIAVVGIDNAVRNRFAWDERRYITPDKYENLRRYTVFPGDVIVTIMGTVGRTAVVPDNIPVAITTKHLATITLNQSVALPDFVALSLRIHPDLVRQIDERNRGAIMPGLNLGLIKSLSLHLPPIAAQRDFVKALREIRAVETRQETAAVDAEFLFASLQERAFSGGL